MAINLSIVFSLSLWLSTGICYHNPCAESDLQKHIGDIAVKLGPREDGAGHGEAEEAEEEEEDEKRAATAYQSWLWPNGIVYYRIEPDDFADYQVEIIRRGIEHWEEKTCIRFQPWTGQQDYINIHSGSFGCCASYVGRTGGKQGVSLNTAWCVYLPIVIHELGHAVGFWHEQSRPDRDDYVDVLYENIINGAGFNFQKQQVDAINSLGVPYDYRSIMHYSSDAWSWNGEDTIVTDPDSDFRGLIGDATVLSPFDIAQANLLYGCEVNECALGVDECEPHSTCQDLKGSYFGSYRCEGSFSCDIGNGGCSHICDPVHECSCYSGYTLASDNRNCIDVNECESAVCTPAQVCVNTHGSYYCVCRVGYVLDSNGVSCIDVDECQTNNGGCEHNCLNFPGSFFCTCKSGYFPDSDGKSCTDRDECSDNTHSCSALEKCVNTVGSYECHCKTGYQLSGNGESCIDIDECQSDNGGCEQICSNSPGTHECECNPGYSLDTNGKSCNDVDECSLANGGCAQLCLNDLGSFECSCSEGYTLDSDNSGCTDVDECASTGDPVCSHTCENTVGGYECSCDGPGYLLVDGKTCLDINECEGDVGCSHFCINTEGSYTCGCRPGYNLTSDGRTCYIPRQNGCGGLYSACNGSISSPHWPTGLYFPNTDCEWTIAPEKENMYLELSFDPYYHIQGTYGSACTTDSLQIFQSNGTDEWMMMGKYCGRFPPAAMEVSSPVRVCFYSNQKHNKKGFGMIYTCKEENDECKVGNGGCNQNCVNTLGSYECKCEVGYEIMEDNKTCADIDECGIVVCGQLCHNTEGSFMCGCHDGYELDEDGTSCIDIDECTVSNGGCAHDCTNHIGFSHECGCFHGYQLHEDGKSCVAFDGCGGYFTTSSGILTSPNYPNKYPDSTDCLWRIVIPETNKAMRLVFSSTFYLKGIKNGRCPYDYVEVFNGNSSSSVSMGEFCGRDPPASFFTSTNEALILFHSNHRRGALGFELSFEAVDGPTGTFECGGNMSSGEVFGTPGFPSYQLNTTYKCTWYHHHQANSTSVEFRISFFDLGDCPSNELRVYDGETSQAPQLTSLCGPLQDSDLVTSTHGSALTVEVVLVTAGRFLGEFLDV